MATYDFERNGEDTFNISLNTRLRKFKEYFGSEFIERVRPRTPVDTGALEAGYGQTQRQDSIDIYNVARNKQNQPYIDYVENGTEKTPPVGMMRTTLLEAKQIAEIAKERAGL